VVQLVPEEMRSEIFIGMEIRIVHTKIISLFSDHTFGKRLRTIIQDSSWKQTSKDLKETFGKRLKTIIQDSNLRDLERKET